MTYFVLVQATVYPKSTFERTHPQGIFGPIRPFVPKQIAKPLEPTTCSKNTLVKRHGFCATRHPQCKSLPTQKVCEELSAEFEVTESDRIFFLRQIGRASCRERVCQYV